MVLYEPIERATPGSQCNHAGKILKKMSLNFEQQNQTSNFTMFMCLKRSRQWDLRGRWKMSWIDPSLITLSEDAWRLLCQWHTSHCFQMMLCFLHFRMLCCGAFLRFRVSFYYLGPDHCQWMENIILKLLLFCMHLCLLWVLWTRIK